MKDKVDQFKELLNKIAEMEDKDSNTGYTAFFHILVQDKKMATQLLLFAVEVLERLSRLHDGGVATKMARSMLAFLPGVNKYYDTKPYFERGDKMDAEAMWREINALNYEYEGMRKILVCLLNYYGGVTLPRQGLVEADPMDLINKYLSETDSMMLGTRIQARDWSKEEKVEEE
jgi:hypothetical protein